MSSSHKNQKLKNYTIETKLQVIADYKRSKSYAAVARKFNVDRHCVARLVKNEERLLAEGKGAKRSQTRVSNAKNATYYCDSDATQLFSACWWWP
jgi:transposase-like protein